MEQSRERNEEKRPRGKTPPLPAAQKGQAFGSGWIPALRNAFPDVFRKENLAPFLLSALTAAAPLTGTVKPFGIALLAAAGNPTAALFSLLGVLLGAAPLADAPGLSVSALLLFAGRIFFGILFSPGAEPGATDRPDKGKAPGVAVPPLSLRQVMGAAAVLLSGVLSLFLRNGLSVPALLSVVIATVSAPFLTGAFAAALDRGVSVLRRPGEWILLYALGRTLSGWQFFLAPGAVLAFAFPLVYAYRRRGGLSAEVLLSAVLPPALALGLSFDPALAGAFALSGTAAALCMPRSPVWAASAAALSLLAVGFASGGFPALSALLPEVMLTLSVLLPLFRFSLIPPAALPVTDGGAAAAAALRERGQSQRLFAGTERLSGALTTLSGVVTSLSDRLSRPGVLEMKLLSERAFESRCADCENRTLCWEREYATLSDALCRLAAALHRKGKASLPLLPKKLSDRCRRLPEILSEVNDAAARRLDEGRRLDKTEVIGDDFAAFSAVLTEVTEGVREDFAPDEEGGRRLSRAFRGKGLSPEETSVSGKRRLSLLLRFSSGARLNLSSEEIRLLSEGSLQTPLTEPRYEISGPSVLLTMESRPRLSAEVGCATRAAGEGTGPRAVNGDATAHFQTEDGRLVTLVADGMGTGGEAALTARLSVRFLAEMLSARVSPAAALRILNNYLRARRLECSAGIDLLELDLYTAEACFLKSGAAPSFVLREGRLFRLLSKTVPVGILRSLDAELIRCTLRPGDTVVMLSDGVLSGSAESAWLLDLLASPSVTAESPADLARRIVAAAATESRDDITAAVVRIAAA